MDKLTVVLADDHSIVREGIGRLVESFGNIEIIGHAVDGYEAVQLTAQLRPHIVILDISMPKLHGVEAVREIKQRSPETKVIMLSMHNKDRYIKDCMRNGASAYLLKESAVKELKDAIDYVLNDQVYLSPTISKNVVKDWLSPKAHTDIPGPLTLREREILKLLAEGHTNKEIAGMLFISPKTVETHRHHINEKLNLGNLADLVRYAIREGLVAVD